MVLLKGAKELGGYQKQAITRVPTNQPVQWDVTTLPKFNIAHENRPSQKECRLPTIDFQGRC